MYVATLCRRQRVRHEGRHGRCLLQRWHRQAYDDQELAETLIEITGSGVGICYEPAGLPTFVKNRIGDPGLAQREIGFSATVSLEDGLRELIEWRAQHAAKVDELRRRALTASGRRGSAPSARVAMSSSAAELGGQPESLAPIVP